jgi:hypothetical protein
MESKVLQSEQKRVIIRAVICSELSGSLHFTLRKASRSFFLFGGEYIDDLGSFLQKRTHGTEDSAHHCGTEFFSNDVV